LQIRAFEWDNGNINHIMERHGIEPEEVEEVFINRPLLRKTYEDRRIALGQTDSGRYLFVVFILKPEGILRVITCRDMDEKERRYYRRERRH
jgi:uncharacterized DUF497 family protein